MQWPRRVVTLVIAVVLAVASLLGAVAFFLPDLRSWMLSNPPVAWVVSFVLLVALCVVTGLWTVTIST